MPPTRADTGDPEPLSTRERILLETSKLIASRGYIGTSTRDIAVEVGIRQPSLFHHFRSKQAVVAELLDRSLRPALERATILAASKEEPAIRLCAYVLSDLRDLLQTRIDARGLYMREIFNDPDFAAQRMIWDTLRATVRTLVLGGIHTGDIRNVPPEQVERILWCLVVETMWVESDILTTDPQGWPDVSTEILMRGILIDPSSWPEVHRRAEVLLETLPDVA